MRNSLFWILTIAAIAIGFAAAYNKVSMMGGESKRVEFDDEMALRYDRLHQQRQQFLDDEGRKVAATEHEGAKALELLQRTIDEQVTAIQKEISEKEEEQKFVDCLISGNCDQCVPGLCRFVADADLSIPDNELLAAIRVSRDGKKCEFKYYNRGMRKASPDVAIDFFDKDGRFLGCVCNVWTFSSVASGSTAVDEETISFDVGAAKYVRVRTEAS